MKNTTIMKLVIGLGLITPTIFMSCSKKSDSPNPSNTSNSITPNNNSTNDSLYTYLKQGDTTIINILNNKLWFLTKINGDTLETGDSLYTMRDYYDYNLHALNFTKLLICDKNLFKENCITIISTNHKNSRFS
jgi:hypothetical protein